MERGESMHDEPIKPEQLHAEGSFAETMSDEIPESPESLAVQAEAAEARAARNAEAAEEAKAAAQEAYKKAA